MTNKDDLRYVRTEEAIRSAFMELISEAPVASVTASAVCRRAEISRNAFYLHYTGVQDPYGTLVGELVDDVRMESLAFVKRNAATGDDYTLEESLIKAVAKHEDLLRALLPADDGSLSKCLVQGIEKAFVEASLYFGEHGGRLEHRLRCAFAAGAIVGLTSRWVAETDRPLEQAAERYRELSASVTNSSIRYLTKESHI